MSIGVRLLRLLGSLVPLWIPHGTAFGNRILKPIYKKLYGSRLEKFIVWKGIYIEGDPTQCVDGNLFFSPKLYDHHERKLMIKHFDFDGVFVDVGANIGAYSLWAAMHLTKKGKILAIEADPLTFLQLKKNILMNDFHSEIYLENIGVSDKKEEIPFYRNKEGNLGGNSFYTTLNNNSDTILKVESLFKIISRNGLKKISFMKMDIEGFELKVLTKFFYDCQEKNYHFPEYILVETEEGPRGKDDAYLIKIRQLFSNYKYEIIFSSKNTFYKLKSIRN